MRSCALIMFILFAVSSMARQQDIADTLSGTIKVGKCQSSIKLVNSQIEIVEPVIERLSGPYRYSSTTSNPPNTVAAYALLSKKYDKRYEGISEFKLKVSIQDSTVTLFSDSRLLTSDMLLAIFNMRKAGGSATFHSIRARRTTGSIALPSFSYDAYKPATTGADLAKRAKG